MIESSSPVATNAIRERVFVHIIESPKPHDLLHRRTEGSVLSEALRLAGIKRTYNLAVNRATFGEAMVDRLIQGIEEHNRVPILHLSLHGNEEQIGLTDDSRFSWRDLRNVLVPMNEAFNGNLLVSLSTCRGAHGQRMAMQTEGEHPFFAIIGNYEDVRWDDSAVAFVAFYHHLFKGAKLERAVEAMKAASGDKNFAVFKAADVRKSWTQFVKDQEAAALARELEQMQASPDAASASATTAGGQQ